MFSIYSIFLLRVKIKTKGDENTTGTFAMILISFNIRRKVTRTYVYACQKKISMGNAFTRKIEKSHKFPKTIARD